MGLSAHADHSLKATDGQQDLSVWNSRVCLRAGISSRHDNPTILPDGNELNKVGSPTQHKVTFLDGGNVLAIQLMNGDTLGHIDAEDLSD